MPGDPRHPGTFISIQSNEQKLGAYLGYNDVSQLRILTVSWPVLEAITLFEPIALNLNKTTAYRLIYDNESLYKLGTDAHAEWPIAHDDTDNEKRNKKARYLACLLVAMEANLGKKLSGNSQTVNSKLQTQWTNLLKEHIPTPKIEIPQVLFATSEETASGAALTKLEVVPPALGPY
jgi:hypothetical protein